MHTPLYYIFLFLSKAIILLLTHSSLSFPPLAITTGHRLLIFTLQLLISREHEHAIEVNISEFQTTGLQLKRKANTWVLVVGYKHRQ